MHRTVPSSLSITAAPSADEGGGGGDWYTVSSTSPSFQKFQCQCNVISGCFVGDFDFCPIKGGNVQSGELDSSCVIQSVSSFTKWIRDRLD